VNETRNINPWLIAVSVMFATFMEVLDTTVVNVSLPHIAGSLSASIDEATWALTSYLVANAIILPMTGWLASTFGRKRLLMLSVVGFTAASFLCGLAPTLGTLIVFRILQGATGGALQPGSSATTCHARWRTSMAWRRSGRCGNGRGLRRRRSWTSRTVRRPPDSRSHHRGRRQRPEAAACDERTDRQLGRSLIATLRAGVSGDRRAPTMVGQRLLRLIRLTTSRRARSRRRASRRCAGPDHRG